MKVLAIDVGVSIGYALVSGNLKVLANGVTQDKESLLPFVREADEIVVENFIGMGRLNKDRKHTIQLIGFFEGVAMAYNKPFSTQNPQTRNRFLKKAAGARHIKSEHAKDALAHAYRFFYNLSKA